ncbi:MAG: hypothetical protein Q9227_002182 [Pyrenula ochraceoflavens]
MSFSAKRRKIAPPTEEVNFDDKARHDFLTGFHKRKLQRTKQAQEAAERKARAERIEERRKVREERKAELERHIQEVNAITRRTGTPDSAQVMDAESDSAGGDISEWQGIVEADPRPSNISREAEYIDEDKYTTVAVEDLDVTRNGIYQKDKDEDSEEEERIEFPGKGDSDEKREKRSIKSSENRGGKPRVRKKKFRYEGKAERKLARLKEKAKNSKQAQARRRG